MTEKKINPTIEAVTKIRNLATAVSGNWSIMKSARATLTSDINSASLLINTYGNTDTIQNWKTMLEVYESELSSLKGIMSVTIALIKSKEGTHISDQWELHRPHVKKIETLYETLERTGKAALPENKMDDWGTLWGRILGTHDSIKSEAEAAGVLLQLIQSNSPEEVDELTDTILKYIPMNYTTKEAHQYTDEYMKAYEVIKKEASQKKNLWDRFLDILAGGVEQNPAQRVMMQRWLDGEKGDLH